MKAGLNQGLALVQVPLKRRERRRKDVVVVVSLSVFFSRIVVGWFVGWLVVYVFRGIFGYNQRMVFFFFLGGEVMFFFGEVTWFFWGVMFWHQKMRICSKQRNHVPNVDIYQGFSLQNRFFHQVSSLISAFLAMYLQPRGNCHLSTVGMTQERKGWGIPRSISNWVPSVAISSDVRSQKRYG